MKAKFFAATAAGAVAAGTGIIAYSTQHPDVRQKIEEKIPASKILYRRLLENSSTGYDVIDSLYCVFLQNTV